ncbi:hypothetical protein AArcSl_0237 [Halalkaliarchaeum desulfuricum]|uniref:Uncharacterized protein n=1 Tax=Halalkaliarchaeum desulfuricum TaxID=2055893 RepID=A0A343TFM0_9EURY|nr:hypothetical protein [Halalkaliarchaeum desulfuricum]AUX07892.1 hypothetical protein AArcSl_0237 [Halalkaliarchaeum desulfuricum]
MVDYYDKLLAAVPAALALGALASLLDPLGFHQGLALGSLAATIILYEAIVRNPPIEPTAANVTASTITGIGWLLAILLYLF